MSKISSVNRHRIRNIYVDRNTAVGNISKVSSVDAIKSITNSTSYRSDSYLLYSEAFYDKLIELKENYREFYLHQQQLRDMLDSFYDNDDKESIEGLVILITNLVEKYNQTYKRLKELEVTLNIIQFSKEIENILSAYQLPLARIGITISDDYSLSFNASLLRNNLSFNPDYILFLFDYENGLIRKLFNVFRSIRMPQKIDKEYATQESMPISGIIVDKKL